MLGSAEGCASTSLLRRLLLVRCAARLASSSARCTKAAGQGLCDEQQRQYHSTRRRQQVLLQSELHAAVCTPGLQLCPLHSTDTTCQLPACEREGLGHGSTQQVGSTRFGVHSAIS